MNKNFFHTISFILTLLFASSYSLTAQAVLLKVPSSELDENQSIARVDVLADSFIRITGVQFTLKWDPTVLEFDKVAYMGIIGLDDNVNFGLTDIDKGIMTFYWYDETSSSGVNGVTLRNGTPLFSLDMKVVGALHSYTLVEFVGDPTVIEMVNADDVVLDFVLEPGMISVGKLSGINDPAESSAKLSVSPNPFKEFIRTEFELKQASEVFTTVYDLKGNSVFSNNKFFGAGKNTMTFQKGQFPAPGSYFLSIKTEEFKEVKKLFFVE